MTMNNQIYYLSFEQLKDKKILENFIYPNKEINYYISDDFSNSFYIQLAYEGFISVSQTIQNNQYLLPEIQFEYAVLEFKNLHIPKKVKKLLNKKDIFEFRVDYNFAKTLDKLISTHKDPWLEGKYLKTLQNVYKQTHNNFKLTSFELYDKNTKELISGEIGYIIGSTYTSLSGFTTRKKKYNNWGKLQMILTANYLEDKKFDFWNLGHPYMQYKIDLGAKILTREEFLKRWKKSRELKPYH